MFGELSHGRRAKCSYETDQEVVTVDVCDSPGYGILELCDFEFSPKK
jgi:hypothetical protein